jgi:hypothetical protein
MFLFCSLAPCLIAELKFNQSIVKLFSFITQQHHSFN